MGSGSYKFYDAAGLYFVTFATVQWVDVFTLRWCKVVPCASYSKRPLAKLCMAYKKLI